MPNFSPIAILRVSADDVTSWHQPHDPGPHEPESKTSIGGIQIGDQLTIHLVGDDLAALGAELTKLGTKLRSAGLDMIAEANGRGDTKPALLAASAVAS